MVAGYNTIRFLFNQNDLTTSSENKVTFIFGTSTTAPPCGVLWEDTFNGSVSFTCPCSPYEDNTNFVVNCTGTPSKDIVFTNVKAQFGFNTNTRFSIDIYNSISTYGYTSIGAIIASDMRIISESSIGYYSSSALYKTVYVSSSNQFGYSVTSNVLYDPYNKLIPDTEFAYSSVGYQTSTDIVFDPYNKLIPDNEHSDSSFGYNSLSNVIFNPYNEFFDAGEYASSSIGYNTSSNIIFNPYNKFFDINEYGLSCFGYLASSSVQFNQLNPFNGNIYSYYGSSANSDIRYSDDPYIKDINFYFGNSVNSTLKYADTYAYILSNQYYGYSSYSDAQYFPGFIGASNFGYNGKLRYFRTNVTTAIFNNCVAGFGFNLHDNSRRPFYFDLSNTSCCTKIYRQLKHIEMLDEHDYDVRYGNQIGWGIACVADFQTRPRFSASSSFGISSSVVDTSVYLGQIEFGYGLSANTRSMYLEKNYDIPYGNFIVNQNEIKVELTKPLDVSDPSHSFIFGSYMHTNFGACYNFGLTRHYVGFTSIWDLTVEEALRPIAMFGYSVKSNLGTTVSLYPYSYYGFSSKTTFYEVPYYMYQGYSSMCENIITENFVEFLEEGELNNDYIYQNENGDPDLDRPSKESIEGMPYTRYIKGRCY